MKNNITKFNFNNYNLRTITKDDEYYFCVVDLRNILSIPQNSRLIQDLTKGFVKSEVLTNGGKQKIYFCSEKDLYKITLRSNSKVAEPFQDWICGEVLPTLRKTGTYTINNNQQQNTPQLHTLNFPIPIFSRTNIRYQYIDNIPYFIYTDIFEILDIINYNELLHKTSITLKPLYLSEEDRRNNNIFSLALNISQILEIIHHINNTRCILFEKFLIMDENITELSYKNLESYLA